MEIKRLVYEITSDPSGEEVIEVGTPTDIGNISAIVVNKEGNAIVYVKDKMWMVVPAHKVCRWFFI